MQYVDWYIVRYETKRHIFSLRNVAVYLLIEYHMILSDVPNLDLKGFVFTVC